MSQLKVLWDATRSSISSYQIRRMIQRQLNTSASTTQLQDQSVSTINNDNTARDSPSANPNDPTLGEAIEAIRSKVLKRSYRNYTRGWRLGAISCACSASVVFLVNFIVTIYGSVYNNGENPGVLYDGDCGKVENLNTGLHLLINALSTILLGSSNYCMQCLSAPTRSEVDAAHAKGTWLDIGIPSVRNLPKISRQRVVLWLLLGASSLPLHLFYNSAVFSSISSNDYFAISVSQSFLDSDECVNCVRPTTYLSNVVMPTSTPWYFSTSVLTEEKPGTETILQQLHTKARNGELERLEPADCIYNYANVIQADRRNVLLVASDDHFPPPSENPYMNDSYIYSVLQFQSNYALGAGSLDAYGWMCTGFSDPEDKPCNSVIDKIQSAPEDWRVGCFTASNPNSYTIACNNETAYPVEYCLSERAEPHCKLQFSLAIAILVTVLNFFKAVLIFYIAYTITEDPLITMGDAVASFIQNEDPTTKYTRPSLSLNTKDASHYVTGPQEYTGQRQRWKDSTSKKRRAVTFTMFLIAVITVSTLLALGIISLPDQQDKSLPALAKLGFGSINPMIVIEWGINGMIPNTLMANLAQPILSFLYFSYNSVFTAMLLGHEWCSYANKRKGLRLSSRELGGSQRSTYFLQLPYRFAIPLMILSGILHWFVSRSIFLVAIDFYSLDGYTSQSEKVCGYSPIAIIATLILGVFMVFCMITIGYTPYKAGIPLAGSCSIAMSAACHGEWAGIDGYDASMQKLQWGVVGESPDGVGLCSFSPTEVKSMEKGKVYAGFGRRRKVRDGKVETDETREIRQSQTTLVEPLTATSSELSLEKRW